MFERVCVYIRVGDSRSVTSRRNCIAQFGFPQPRVGRNQWARYFARKDSNHRFVIAEDDRLSCNAAVFPHGITPGLSPAGVSSRNPM
jgi:hypothetical protein